jgi:hypothetical protein
MKEEKQIAVTLITISFIAMLFPLFIYRLALVDHVESRFRWYASAYVCEAMEEEGSDLRPEDVNLIVNRLTPPKLSSAFNLLKWSESHFAKNKELLIICKEVWTREEEEKRQKEINAEKSFNERLEAWKKKK